MAVYCLLAKSFPLRTIGKISFISVKKALGKLKEIGRSSFRVKNIGEPTFKIGSGRDSMTMVELSAQEFVRAELDGKYGFDIRFTIESFEVCFIPTDTCKYIVKRNTGNKINDDIKSELKRLKPNDILIFKKIIITGPLGRKEIEPRMIIIKP